MSNPLENHRLQSAADDHVLDRLVDGELCEIERRDVLMRLQAEPDGWRRCALAFLEAQSWRETFAPLATPDRRLASIPEREESSAAPLKKIGKRQVLHFVGRYAALAASLIVAFVLGSAWHGGIMRRPPTPLAQGGTSAPKTVQSTVVERGVAPSSETDGLAGPVDPVVKQWEQRGFQAERQRRVVSVALKDGRRVAVPVEELRLRYVGGRTY